MRGDWQTRLLNNSPCKVADEPFISLRKSRMLIQWINTHLRRRVNEYIHLLYLSIKLIDHLPPYDQHVHGLRLRSSFLHPTFSLIRIVNQCMEMWESRLMSTTRRYLGSRSELFKKSLIFLIRFLRALLNERRGKQRWPHH